MDVRKVAMEVAGGWGLDEFAREMHAKEIASALEAAILTERERCAAAATSELKNTGLLMSNPPQSSAAWEIRNRVNMPEKYHD